MKKIDVVAATFADCTRTYQKEEIQGIFEP